jgi:flagellar basal-body rod protein FlgB
MTMDDLPILATLRSRLSYLSNRQRLLAENVANADTPSYTPRDLKPFTVPGGQGAMGLAPVTLTETSSMHISAGAAGADAAYKPVASPDSESTLNGNSVVLEDEMMKMTEARTDFQAAVGFYEKSMSLIQEALKRPGS